MTTIISRPGNIPRFVGLVAQGKSEIEAFKIATDPKQNDLRGAPNLTLKIVEDLPLLEHGAGI